MYSKNVVQVLERDTFKTEIKKFEISLYCWRGLIFCRGGRSSLSTPLTRDQEQRVKLKIKHEGAKKGKSSKAADSNAKELVLIVECSLILVNFFYVVLELIFTLVNFNFILFMKCLK